MTTEPRKAFLCPACRGAHGDPLYVGPGGLCYGCWLDTYIPFGHQGREKYEYDSAWGRLNATRRPRVGGELPHFLDLPRPRVWQVLLMCKGKPRM